MDVEYQITNSFPGHLIPFQTSVFSSYVQSITIIMSRKVEFTVRELLEGKYKGCREGGFDF